MAPDLSPEARAAQAADVALKYIEILMKDHEGKTDANVASALSNLAVYHQLRALTGQQRETVERIQSNTDTLFHLSGGLYKLNGEVSDVRFAIDRLEGTVGYAAQSPLRKATERFIARWNRLRLRHMPRPPIATTVRYPDKPTPARPVTPMFLVDKYTGTMFEELLVRLLEEAGWDDVKHIGGAGDMGVDILAKSGDVVLAVQAKRWSQRGTVGSSQIRDFVGGAHKWHNANALIFITTTDKITSDALSFAEAAGVVIVDRAATKAWVESGIVPEIAVPPGGLVSAVEPKVEVPAPAPPPQPPKRPQKMTALLLVLSLIPASLTARFPDQQTLLALVSLGLMTVAAMLWVNFQWRAHGWRVGVRRYWSKWTVDTSSGKPVFVPPK